MKTMILAGALAAVLLVHSKPAAAQFNAEWCTLGWMLDCAYHTLAQCRAAASGNGWDCVRNPERQRAQKRRDRDRR